MSSFEVNIVIDDVVLGCCKCCCCCPIGECNWLDLGGYSIDPPIASANITHPSSYSVRFDFDNAHNNPFPLNPNPIYTSYAYSCEGWQNLRQMASSSRGFKKTGSGTISVKYEANIEKHEPGFDCGSFAVYRCLGATDNIVGMGGEIIISGGGCSQGCPPTYDHPATSECYCEMLPVPETTVNYTENCSNTSHYRFEASVDSVDGSWHHDAYWKFTISGVTVEDCATPALITLNKRKIRANLLDRMKKLSLTGIKALKNKKWFKEIEIRSDRSKVLIQGKKWKRIL